MIRIYQYPIYLAKQTQVTQTMIAVPRMMKIRQMNNLNSKIHIKRPISALSAKETNASVLAPSIWAISTL